MRWKRTRAIVWQDMKELPRDPITIGIAVLLPLVMLFLFGYAVTLDVKDIAIGVLDHDQSPASRELVDRFVQSGYFVLNRSFISGAALERAMKRGHVKLALVIPPRFHAALARGESAGVQLVVDGTHAATAMLVAAYAAVVVEGFTAVETPRWASNEANVFRRTWNVRPGIFTHSPTRSHFFGLNRSAKRLSPPSPSRAIMVGEFCHDRLGNRRFWHSPPAPPYDPPDGDKTEICAAPATNTGL